MTLSTLQDEARCLPQCRTKLVWRADQLSTPRNYRCQETFKKMM